MGIFDPTPISDGASGVVSLFRGDWMGAGLSVAAMVPYVGDAAAKPAKLAKLLAKNEFIAKRIVDPEWMRWALQSLKHVSVDKLGDGVATLNSLAREAKKGFTAKTRPMAVKHGLPTDLEGPVPFVPPKGWQGKPERGGGFRDAYGNLWKKATDGKDEWDVQVKKGTKFSIFCKNGNQGKDFEHANISPDGYVTH
ncbi:hypothetical protein ACFQ0M_05840 [Kitasatospora aburaviensis]